MRGVRQYQNKDNESGGDHFNGYSTFVGKAYFKVCTSTEVTVIGRLLSSLILRWCSNVECQWFDIRDVLLCCYCQKTQKTQLK